MLKENSRKIRKTLSLDKELLNLLKEKAQTEEIKTSLSNLIEFSIYTTLNSQASFLDYQKYLKYIINVLI